jgi:hypothetical protein
MAFSDEIAILDAACMGCLKVLPERRVTLFNDLLRQVAVDDAKLRGNKWIPIAVRFNDSLSQLSRAWQYWAQEALRDSASSCVSPFENEELVSAGRDPSLNPKKVP